MHCGEVIVIPEVFPWLLKVCFFWGFFYIYRESFPNDLQFTILMRFTVDQTQTPNLKVSSVSVFVCVRVCACV